MQTNRAISILAISITLGLSASLAAQNAPLSAIDWLHLKKDAVATPETPQPVEPPPLIGPAPSDITVSPLDATQLRPIGLILSDVSGLPGDLWRESAVADLETLLKGLPDLRLPAAQSLLYQLLLTETVGPAGDQLSKDTFTLLRVATLERFGALEPAMALIEQAGVTRDRAHFASYMRIALMQGSENTACRVLQAQTHLAPGYSERIFCAARLGDWHTAALLYDIALSLNLLGPDDAAMLERFLHSDAFEDLPSLGSPQQVTPLAFRVHESVGEPIPTTTLPRAYAVADLRDIAGWKAQLQAAERLARSGALSANQLLGLYSARRPAASGGIWDRVAAVQALDAALRAQNSLKVAEALPAAWHAMRQAGLEYTFAQLFAQRLERLTLATPADVLANTITLLASETAQTSTDDDPFLNGIVTGGPLGAPGRNATRQAVAFGFTDAAARDSLINMAANGRLGEAVLRSISLLENGYSGDMVALSTALATLRRLGFNEIARQAALQILILERPS